MFYEQQQEFLIYLDFISILKHVLILNSFKCVLNISSWVLKIINIGITSRKGYHKVYAAYNYNYTIYK